MTGAFARGGKASCRMRGKRDAMSDPEPRRRRPSAPPPRSSAGGTGGGPLPMAALIIGVIVAGLGIGALVSAFQNRGTLPELGATSAPAVTPVAQPTGPQPVVTLSPSPSPSPTASPSRSPSPTPSHAASPSPTPAATSTPSAAPAVSASAAAPTPTAAAAVKPAGIIVPPSPLPTVRPTVAPTVAPTVRASVPPSPSDTAIALVRRYVDDLIGGDEAGAYAALGGTSSDHSLDLKEEAFLDKDARITSMRVSRSDGSGATVDAEITSGHGSYVATFHVTYGPSGSIINQHDYIKI